MDFLTLVHSEPEWQDLPFKEHQLKLFERFMDDVNIEFRVFASTQLNQELREQFFKIFYLKYFDVMVAIEPEYLWKLYFERIYLEKIDRYTKLLKIQLESLVKIEDQLFTNVDMSIEFNENQNITENQTKDQDSTGTLVRDTTNDVKKDGTRNDDETKNKDQTSREFTRDLYEETPNGQLNLTSNDGSGVISTATTINESLDTATDTTKDVNKLNRKDSETTNAKENRVDDTHDTLAEERERKQQQEKENTRTLKGYQALQSKGKLLQDYENLFDDTMSHFVNCFDGLFRVVY